MRATIRLITEGNANLGLEDVGEEADFYFLLEDVKAGYVYDDEDMATIMLNVGGVEYPLVYEKILWNEIKNKLDFDDN